MLCFLFVCFYFFSHFAAAVVIFTSVFFFSFCLALSFFYFFFCFFCFCWCFFFYVSQPFLSLAGWLKFAWHDNRFVCCLDASAPWLSYSAQSLLFLSACWALTAITKHSTVTILRADDGSFWKGICLQWVWFNLRFSPFVWTDQPDWPSTNARHQWRSPILFPWRMHCVKREWELIFFVFRESIFFRPRETGFSSLRDLWNMH